MTNEMTMQRYWQKEVVIKRKCWFWQHQWQEVLGRDGRLYGVCLRCENYFRRPQPDDECE